MADYWPDLCARVSPHHAQCVRLTLRRFREHFGSQPARSLTPSLLRDWRAAVSPEVSPGTAARATTEVLAMYRWAVAHELVPVEVLQRLRCLEPLRKPRPKPVGPAPAEAIEAVRAVVTPPIRAMIKLQLLTGMRSGEVCTLRPCDIDMAGKVWLYRLVEHKTAHHGHNRVVYLGPQAQAVLRPFLVNRATTAHCFRPAESRAAWEAARHAARKTPLSCGNRPGTNRRDNPRRKPKDRYAPTAYARAVARACARARVPHWHPHQLRHNYATTVRAKYGLEAARILLGHCSALVTEAVYAERDQQAAMRVAAEIG